MVTMPDGPMHVFDMTHLAVDESLLHIAADLPRQSAETDPPIGLFLAVSRYAFIPDTALTFFPCRPDLKSIERRMAELDLGADMVVVDLHQRFSSQADANRRLKELEGKPLRFNVAKFHDRPSR